MPRFLASHRRADKTEDWQHHRAREALGRLVDRMAGDADVVGQNRPAADHARHVIVLDAEHHHVRAMQADLHDDLILEPRYEHHFDHVRPEALRHADRTELKMHPGDGASFHVHVADDHGRPLGGVTVYLYLDGPDGPRQLTATTDAGGRCVFEFSPRASVVHVATVPHDGYWSMLGQDEAYASPGLPPAEQHLGWWHHQADIHRYATTRGRGIRVGVIDTGVGPNANLAHVHDLGSIIDAELDESGGADVASHGSHVAGIVGARATDPAQYGGVAPGCTLYSLRVFSPGHGAHQGDIALALWEMAHERRAHLVNLSLSTVSSSQIEQDAIRDAARVGTLCICAAGNAGSAVQFPAAFDEAIAVAAVGVEGWAPDGTLSASRRPTAPDHFGSHDLYLANFSCRGPEIAIAGPGVGIISTVPGADATDAPYAEFGGTSMASPFVTGVLAARLSRDKAYKRMAPGEERTKHARDILRDLSADIGLSPDYQGAGLVRLRW